MHLQIEIGVSPTVACETRLRGTAPFELFERAWPVVAQQPRQRTIHQQPTARLTVSAVVGLVRRIDHALNRRAAIGARLPVAAMNSHPLTEGRHFLRELVAGLLLKP